MFAVNPETGVIASANQRFAELLARGDDELAGTRLDELLVDRAALSAVLTVGTSLREIAFQRADGTATYIPVRGVAMSNLGFGPLLAFVSPVTPPPAEALRDADADAPLSGGELSQLVKELSEAKQELEDRSEGLAALAGQVSRFGWRAAVGELVGGIAHHLNNPLGALASVQRRIDARLGEISDDELRTSLQRLSAQGRALVERLETNVLALMRTQQLTAAPDAPQALELAPEIEAALTLFSGRLQRVIVVREYDQLLPVIVPQEALHLVLSHLIDNALRAMHDRGTLTINLCGAQDAVAIRISDTGGGVRPELRARLFEPLLTARSGGAGLGLSTAQRLAREWGGDLRYAPRPGGSTFEVRLPARAVDERAPAPAPRPPVDRAASAPASMNEPPRRALAPVETQESS